MKQPGELCYLPCEMIHDNARNEQYSHCTVGGGGDSSISPPPSPHFSLICPKKNLACVKTFGYFSQVFFFGKQRSV
jgi:hypothetical protein